MRKWALPLILFAVPLLGQTVEDSLRAEVDSLKTELQQTQTRFDTLKAGLEKTQKQFDDLLHSNNPFDLSERITEAYESGTKLSNLAIIIVGLIFGVVGLIASILGIVGLKQAFRASDILGEATEAKIQVTNMRDDIVRQKMDLTNDFQEIRMQEKKALESVERIKKALAGVNYLDRGHYYLFMKDYEEALRAFEKATKEDPQRAEAWLYKGHCLYKLNHDNEAFEAYTKAIELKPTLFSAQRHRSIMLARGGRYEDALVVCNLALEIRPEDGRAHSNKAFVLEYLKRYGEAQQSAERAIEVSGGKNGHFNLSCILCRQGKLKEALKHLRIATEKGENRDFLIGGDPWTRVALEPLRKGHYLKRFIEIVGPLPKGQT
jgi:tetratricopeptide (TPR) repeat protein